MNDSLDGNEEKQIQEKYKDIESHFAYLILSYPLGNHNIEKVVFTRLRLSTSIFYTQITAILNAICCVWLPLFRAKFFAESIGSHQVKNLAHPGSKWLLCLTSTLVALELHWVELSYFGLWQQTCLYSLFKIGSITVDRWQKCVNCQAQFQLASSVEVQLRSESSLIISVRPHPTQASIFKALISHIWSWNLVWKLYSTKLSQLAN